MAEVAYKVSLVYSLYYDPKMCPTLPQGEEIAITLNGSFIC